MSFQPSAFRIPSISFAQPATATGVIAIPASQAQTLTSLNDVKASMMNGKQMYISLMLKRESL